MDMTTNDFHDNPDADMEVYCVLSEDVPEVLGHLVWIFHDKPFTKTLSWIEYDLTNNRLDFILEDGDIRNFGIPVDPSFRPYLQNSQVLPVMLTDRNDEPVDGETYPLIIHSA